MIETGAKIVEPAPSALEAVVAYGIQVIGKNPARTPWKSYTALLNSSGNIVVELRINQSENMSHPPHENVELPWLVIEAEVSWSTPPPQPIFQESSGRTSRNGSNSFPTGRDSTRAGLPSPPLLLRTSRLHRLFPVAKARSHRERRGNPQRRNGCL